MSANLYTARRHDGRSPEVTRGVLHDGRGNLLLGMRADSGGIELVGGRRELDDVSIEAAMIREIYQEFGLILRDTELSYITVSLSESKSDPNHPNIVTSYSALVNEEKLDDLDLNCGEVIDALWLPQDLAILELAHPDQQRTVQTFMEMAVDLRLIGVA